MGHQWLVVADAFSQTGRNDLASAALQNLKRVAPELVDSPPALSLAAQIFQRTGTQALESDPSTTASDSIVEHRLPDVGEAVETPTLDGLPWLVPSSIRLTSYWSNFDLLRFRSGITGFSGLTASRLYRGGFLAVNRVYDREMLVLHDRYREGSEEFGPMIFELGRSYARWGLAAYEDDGRSLLLLARSISGKWVDLYAMREPLSMRRPASFLWMLRVEWPDEPRVIAAVGVDAAAREVLLFANSRGTTQVLRVSLPLPEHLGKMYTVAEPITMIRGVSLPPEEDLAVSDTDNHAAIIDADLSSDGRTLLLLTPRHAYTLVRAAGETWRNALERELQAVRTPLAFRAGSVALDLEARSVWIGTEEPSVQLIRLDPENLGSDTK